MRTVILALVLLLAGCASASAPPNPYTTPEVERDRATCLASGGLWMETAHQYTCRRTPEKERT